jgi:transcriptional regulator with XRE-family HTH domain
MLRMERTESIPLSCMKAGMRWDWESFPEYLDSLEKYGSLDRFYLETDFSKGHLSQILRGKRSPSLATMTKLAKVLNVRVAELFRPA